MFFWVERRVKRETMTPEEEFKQYQFMSEIITKEYDMIIVDAPPTSSKGYYMMNWDVKLKHKNTGEIISIEELKNAINS